MSKLLYIDPGHGGVDAGAILGPRTEKNDNLTMALKVKNLIEANTTIKAKMARDTDIAVGLYDRPKEAVALKADALLSFHRNAFNGKAFGTEVWVKRFPSAEELEWAEIIMGRLAAVGTSANRGVKKGQFAVLENAFKIPAIMVENLFIDNPSDNSLYDKHFNANAETIAKGTAQFLGEAWGTNPQPKEYIKIQGGAFSLSNEEGARKALAAIREAGKKHNIPELEAFWLVMPSDPKDVKDY